jgi:hypothetical protein
MKSPSITGSTAHLFGKRAIAGTLGGISQIAGQLGNAANSIVNEDAIHGVRRNHWNKKTDMRIDEKIISLYRQLFKKDGHQADAPKVDEAR